MTVKTIFKTLIGTVVLIVLSSLLWELFNLQISSIQLSSMMQMSATKSAELFAQETYKTNGKKGAANLSNIYYPAGTSDSGDSYGSGFYVSGQFYSGLDTYSIWHSIYDKPDFKEFVNSDAAIKGNWYSLKIFKKALDNDTYAPVPNWNASPAQIQAYDDATMAKLYIENLYTPLNIGIPYLDKDTVEKIFRWNLTQMLSSSNEANIMMDETGTPYVTYQGFRCYANQAKITNITYTTYDLTNKQDKDKFYELTNIEADKLGYLFDADALGIDNDERQRVCIAAIEYSMPVSYKGITPIKNVFNYVWDKEVVEGVDGTTSYNREYSWNDSTATMTGGGEGDNTLPTSGKILYYMIR